VGGHCCTALDGVSTAYYLVHSMCSGGDFAERDRQASTNFVEARGGCRPTGRSGHDPCSPAVRLVDEEGVIREVRTRMVTASADDVFRSFSSLGGARGWLVWNAIADDALSHSEAPPD
jgi:hypothetical protein